MSLGSEGKARPEGFEVVFEVSDVQNPLLWPVWYRGIVLGCVSFATWTVVLFSTSYTASISAMNEDFHNPTVAALGITTYLFGLGCGCVLFAPVSEIYGRKPVYIGCLFAFTVLILPCALADNLTSIVVSRFFVAVAGSATIANSPGTVTDLSSEEHRAFAFSVWSLGVMTGPVTGPLVGGLITQHLGWRWTNWFVMILGGICFIALALLNETYAPVILNQKAASRRRQTGDTRWWSKYEEQLNIFEVLKVNLLRPFRLAFTEPVLWFWNLYISITYGILFLCFVAYPYIFIGMRGWSLAVSGLGFAGIGLGALIAVLSEPLMRRVINLHGKDSETGQCEPEASVSVICFAALLVPAGQLWFAWTCVPITIHWIWPILAGILFGLGSTIIFIHGCNYIARSYGRYAASALASNTVARSILGGTLPLAAPAMYSNLDPRWAGTILCLLLVACIPIPFVFYKWGKKIRLRSSVIRKLREEQEATEAVAKNQISRQQVGVI